MPRLNPVTDLQASETAKALFGKIQAMFGMVPNIFRTMGHAPEVLQATLAMNQAIQKDLDAKLRELAYLKASQLNACNYCLHYHKTIGQKTGLTDAQLKDLEQFETSSAYSDVEKLVLRFAEQWTRQGRVASEVIKQLSQKLSPAQLLVLSATCGLANWTNRFNETFGIELP